MNKKSKKPKDKKKEKEKVLLDTSIHLERIKYPDWLKKAGITKPDRTLHTSHFVLYEFKVGFIRALIDYYDLVRIEDSPSKAMAKWSELFSKRDIKNFIILQSMIAGLNGYIEGSNTSICLTQVEAAINAAISTFKEDIDRWLVGDFNRDDVVLYEITQRDTYKGFVDLCNSRKGIPMTDFWKKNKADLDTLIKNKKAFGSKFAKGYKKLEEIHTDPSEADRKVTLNKALGDAVISVDSPQNYILLSTDSYQGLLRSLLGYPYITALKR